MGRPSRGGVTNVYTVLGPSGDTSTLPVASQYYSRFDDWNVYWLCSPRKRMKCVQNFSFNDGISQGFVYYSLGRLSSNILKLKGAWTWRDFHYIVWLYMVHFPPKLIQMGANGARGITILRLQSIVSSRPTCWQLQADNVFCEIFNEETLSQANAPGPLRIYAYSMKHNAYQDVGHSLWNTELLLRPTWGRCWPPSQHWPCNLF